MKIMMKNVMFSVAEKSSLVSGNGGVNFFLSFTCLHSRMCKGIYIFNFKKQTSKQKKNKNTKKAKET